MIKKVLSQEGIGGEYEESFYFLRHFIFSGFGKLVIRDMVSLDRNNRNENEYINWSDHSHILAFCLLIQIKVEKRS